jgi:hypothetical protein
MTVGQGIDIGPFTFTVLRLLVAVGLVRVLLRRESLTGRWNRLDSLVVAFGIWACASSAFHEDVSTTLVTHLGIAYDVWGIYFLLRSSCSTLDDVVRLCRIAAFILLPVALEMLYEQLTFHNLFSIFGAVPDTPQFRDGRIRAFGPFAHPILAGSVGGVMLPLMLAIWRQHRLSACIGILVCVTMVAASASSGPAMSALVGVGAVCMWGLRRYMRLFRWMLVGVYFALLLVMDRAPYYIIQRLEVVGGSTGWYRSRLIEVAIDHVDEWWIGGTDYTRHWIDGNAISDTQIDITSHYLTLGVVGGLPLMLVHIAILVTAFSFVGRGIGAHLEVPVERQFTLWTLGSALVAHAVTNVSVSYFDQSILFLYLTLAAIGSAHAAQQTHAVSQAVPPAAVDRVHRLRHPPGRSGWSRVPDHSSASSLRQPFPSRHTRL